MGNQQQNCNLKFTGKTIKPEHYIEIINQYKNGECPVDGYKYKWITRCSTTIIETSNKMDEGIV